MRVIKIYAKNVWKIGLVYKWEIFVSILAGIFNVAAMLFIWYVVYKNSGKNVIDGYSFNSIMLYTIMANLTGNLIYLDTSRTISEDVKSGEITNSFIRPISYIKKLVGEAIGYILFNFILLFLPVILSVISYSLINGITFEVTLSSIILYIIAIIFSIIINFGIELLIGLCSFFVNYIWGFIMLKSAILMIVTGELFPISFFPKAVVKVLEFTPFYYINYGPVSILLNKFSRYNSYKMILIQLTWCIILGIIVKIFWEKSKTKLQVNGG